jgi:soluble lytic murein transglycosylase
VGNAKSALQLLSSHKFEQNPDADVRLAAQLIQARAYLESNAPKEALKALGSLTQSRDEAIIPVVALIQLRAAVLQKNAELILQSANILRRSTGVPESILVEARAQRAYVLGNQKDPKKRKEAVRELKSLSKMRAARSLRPGIIENLIELLPGPKQRAYVIQLLVHYGGSEPGRRAMKRVSPSTLSEKQKWRRVDQLMTVWSNDLADETLTELQKTSDRKGRQKALLLRAKIRMRMRVEYPEALKFLVEACKGPDREMADEAWYRRGLILGNLKRWRESVSVMRKLVKRKPQGRLLKRAAYQIGRLQHQAGHFRKAGPEIKNFVDGLGRGEDTWQWFVGWAYYRAGRYAQARTEWDGLKSKRNLLVGPKALYWIARTYLHEGAKEKAKATLLKLSKRAPLGYYGLLGAALYAQNFDESASPWPPRPERFPLALPEAIDLRAKLPGRKNRALRSKIRAIQLRSAVGFPNMAREVGNPEQLEKKLVQRLGSDKRRMIRDGLTFWLELWGKRFRKEARKRMAWASGLHHFDSELVGLSLPPSYLMTARAAGAMHKVSPWWLISHMLQESRYKENAISHAGALGPMQILPITGRHIAREAGFPKGDFSAGRLFEPGVSLRQAAWYLSALRAEFGGSTLMAIASYNGGPRRMSEYLTGDNANLPMDEFIEEIGAHETRNYVRKVTDHLVRYVTIYGTDEERKTVLRALIPAPKLPTPRGDVRF